MEFHYLAQDKAGKRITATAIADAIPVLVTRLKNQGLLPLSITEIKSAKNAIPLRGWWSNRRVQGKELAVFTRQLASTLSAGILLNEALGTISEDLENQYFSQLLMRIKDDINSGTNFSTAISRYPKVFSKIYVAMVRSGEESGGVDKTLVHLAKYLEGYERIKEKIKSAMRYPLFISIFFVFVVSVIVLFLIPKFEALFSKAGARLPLLTRIVIGISKFCLQYYLPFLGFLFLVGLLIWNIARIPRIKLWLDTLRLEIPVVGKLINKALVSRFCRTLSILLSGGVRMLTALSITAEVLDNDFLQQTVGQMRNRVIGGTPLSETIKAQKVFPRLVFKMASVGEKSGKLDDMLKRTADYYDEELETALTNLTALIEPVLIVLIGAVVLVVVLALYLPIIHLSMTVH